MASINNVRIGHATLTFGGVSLGHTMDGVEIEFAREFEDLSVDQYGNTPIDMALTGQDVTIKVKLAEPNVSSLNVAIPEGGHASGGSGERLGIGTDAGYLLRTDSKQLVIHPAKNAASDDSEDITIYKAVSSEAVPTNFKIDEQRVFEVTFRALLDETYASGRRLGHVGPANVS